MVDQTNKYERNFEQQGQLKRPGRIDLRIFQYLANCGDGYPGLQYAMHHVLGESLFPRFVIEGCVYDGSSTISSGYIMYAGKVVKVSQQTGLTVNNSEFLYINSAGNAQITAVEATAKAGVMIYARDSSGVGKTTIFSYQSNELYLYDAVVRHDINVNNNLDVGNNITVAGLVDGVDVSVLKTDYDAHAANILNPHTVSLDQAFDQSKIINGADSVGNAFQVGGDTNYWKMYENTVVYLMANNQVNIGTTSNNSVNFYTNNNGKWNIAAGGDFFPMSSNAYDIGNSSYEIRQIYCCGTVNDTTCADFSNYSYDKLYNMFAQIKPMDDGGLHIDNCRDDIYYPHMDFTTLPKEFSVPADKDMSKKSNLWELNKKGETVLREVHYKKGDTLGIIAGNHQYALGSLVVKMGEKIKELEEQISILRGF